MCVSVSVELVHYENSKERHGRRVRPQLASQEPDHQENFDNTVRQ